MDGTAATGRAARLLAVLTVLLGLLAMHGLASAHHAAASKTGRDATTVATAQAGGPLHRYVVAAAGAMHVETMTVAAQVLVSPVGPSCAADCPDVAILCLAVLTGAALALLLARRRTTSLLLVPARRRTRAPAPPVRHARGPDPVRELCVSRT